MGWVEAWEFSVEDNPHFLLYYNLLSLVKLEITIGASFLSRVAASVLPKWRNLVWILFQNNIVAIWPALKVNFDSAIVHKLFCDLTNAPVVYLVFGVNIICHCEQFARGRQSPVPRLLKLFFLRNCHVLSINNSFFGWCANAFIERHLVRYWLDRRLILGRFRFVNLIFLWRWRSWRSHLTH